MDALDDRFETRIPSARNALEIFAGKWISKIPHFGFGTAGLFEDPRIDYFDAAIGGFAGKTVIELGPLDGGHTFIMSALGAARIISIPTRMLSSAVSSSRRSSTSTPTSSAETSSNTWPRDHRGSM